ncbi:MAG: alpha-amylase [Spirochaetaceae bacterium]|jgi:glycosidase|nr:alpha-amylase [Spirochaetaceae bacterium]
MGVWYLSLSTYEKSGAAGRVPSSLAVREFHIRRDVRDEYSLEHALFSLRGNVVLTDFRQVRDLTRRFNAKLDPARPQAFIQAGQLNAMGLIDEILHYMAALYRQQVQGDAFETALARLENTLGPQPSAELLGSFSEQFPPQAVYAGRETVADYLRGTEEGESCRSLSLEELLLLALANLNPAFKPFTFLFDDRDLAAKTVYTRAIAELQAHFAELPPFGPDGLSLWDLLRSPALASPDSLIGQLEFMRKKWGMLLGKFMARILTGLDVIREEEKPSFFGPGPTQVYTYGGLDNEYERFSPDQDWMPRTVLMAKSTLVWLYQLSQRYGRTIERLDQIPDEELDSLARRGFTGLWLIGLWERSNASKTVKQWTGNPEAAASAYSLYDYDIAGELGGWGGLVNLRDRCFRRGIRLGSDMVPNHTGIDSRWIMEHPGRFLQLSYPPFPTYTFNGGNLSSREGVGVYIEDHYYNRSDAAVVFKRVDFSTGETRYIYHGNDGTSMPWNDTAQIDFLNPEAREAVIRTIVGVCKQFSIVRFDAAMTLAKRHIQRLWYPEPGHGGDIASRAEHAISTEEFNRRIPNEFWREVVDRCAAEAPNTLLLAEAFWMMEGYFVRTLGMHRVYNSAFMNMLKNEENAKYRATIKNTLEFDPEILKRFVNFMNNPDEETAVAQFGKGDKYFGICTLLVTMPGLPMFGHGQIEGFEEKYGMEYRRSYRNESPDSSLVDRHEREIFPLMKKRGVFSGSAAFRLYDVHGDGGVNENIFAYSNRDWDDRAFVLYNNSYYAASGWVRSSSPAIPQGDGGFRQDTLSEALSIHGEEHYFTIFREQRSGLWFIRSSKDLAERGIFVSLRGYEAQVFLDIHEVEDHKGRWARLNHELSGRGVEDLEAAIRDIFLGELYRAFSGLFRGEYRDQGYRNAGVLEEPVLAFITTAQEYIRGAARGDPRDRYDPFVTEWEHPALEAERIREEFTAYLYRWSLLSTESHEPPPPGLGKTVLDFLGDLRSENRKNVAVFAAAYGVLSLLRSVIGGGASGADARALVDHWQLDRKLRECLSDLGAGGDEAYRVVELMKAVLARTSPEDTEAYRDIPLGEALMMDNYHAEDFRRLLGVNLFEDTVWFNKEAFEEALFYASLFLALEDGAALEAVRRPPRRLPDAAFTKAKGSKAPAAAKGRKKPGKAAPDSAESLGPWLKRVETIAALKDQFLRAEAASGYKLERLIEALCPPRDA